MNPTKCLYTVFQGRAGETLFRSLVKNNGDKKNTLLGTNEKIFRNDFKNALREVLSLEPGKHISPVLNQMLKDDDDRTLISTCRTALTIAALKHIDAGLVIFDEFQRFRDLMDDVDEVESNDIDVASNRAAASVIKSIRGLPKDGSGPALLLLSATPYTASKRQTKNELNEERIIDPSSDFFELVKFLADDICVANRTLLYFQKLSHELRKGDFDSVNAQSLRAILTKTLLPLMSRTERPEQQSESGKKTDLTSAIETDLIASDVAQFCDMHECFSDSSKEWIVPLWQSVPLPMQTLGSRYVAWTSKEKMPETLALTKGDRDKHKLLSPWPHPRVRALMSKLSEKRLAMPWTSPSLPWWPLKGGWKAVSHDETIEGKLLVFSRFKAVPTALSGLISYTTESRLLASNPIRDSLSYEAASKRRLLSPSPDRPGLLELFHPSPFLSAIDPLLVPLGDKESMRRDMERQLIGKLKNMGVKVVSNAKWVRRKPWQLLVALEMKNETWYTSSAAWIEIAKKFGKHDSEGSLTAMIGKWNKVNQQDIENLEISKDTELPALVALALESPGIVFLRALTRHWPQAALAENLSAVVSVVWRGLRSYLDKSWFVSALGDRKGSKYPNAIRNAVINGNFESVLDEHFWFLSKDASGDWLVRLEEVEKSLRLRDANVTFHGENSISIDSSTENSSSFSIRCHVAVPLSEVRKKSATTLLSDGENLPNIEDEPLRPDEIRKAFNSPFWPNVLVTTSIGQEGLDLHPWCNALAHWDLANSAVALEQREGRITRFGSLSVRRAIAKKLGMQLDKAHATSPWCRLERLANDQAKDSSGLKPWWIFEGGQSKNFYLTVPGGEQQERYETLSRERALYRLVLGMPDQTDLIRLLDAQGKNTEALRGACLDLSAYNNKK